MLSESARRKRTGEKPVTDQYYPGDTRSIANKRKR